MYEIRKLSFRPTDAVDARQYLSWMYESPYDFYNFIEGDLEAEVQYLTDPKNNLFSIYDGDGQLVGYCSFGRDAQVPGGDYSAEALDIGLMIRPDLTGLGLGSIFVDQVIEKGVQDYTPRLLRVTIAAFNLRAQKVWRRCGFQQVQDFESPRERGCFVILTRSQPGES